MSRDSQGFRDDELRGRRQAGTRWHKKRATSKGGTGRPDDAEDECNDPLSQNDIKSMQRRQKTTGLGGLRGRRRMALSTGLEEKRECCVVVSEKGTDGDFGSSWRWRNVLKWARGADARRRLVEMDRLFVLESRSLGCTGRDRVLTTGSQRGCRSLATAKLQA